MGPDFILRKEGLSIHPAGKIIKRAVYQEFVKADALVRKAREEAEWERGEAAKVIDDAKSRADAIIEAADRFCILEKEKGFKQGLIEGQRRMAEKITQTVMDAEIYLNSIEDQIATAIVSAVRMIIGQIGDETVMRHLVTQALNSIRDQKHLILRVAPQQAAFVTRCVNEIRSNYPDIAFIDVVAETGLGPGSCILETKMGFVDTSVDVQLETIRKNLRRHFTQHKDELHA